MIPRHFGFRLACRYLLGAALALAPASPWAQEDVDDAVPGQVEIDLAEPEPVSPEGVEAITVTGEQLDITDVQDEAAAISRFDMDDLDKMNIASVEGLALHVPGLHIGQQGQNAIVTLRGVGTENASLNGEPGVAFHVDGINYGRPAAARVAFFDLQGIEVNRGPQGLRGGKNSTSGSINVTTNDPDSEYQVEGDVLLGNYDRVRVRGMLNVPIGELLAARLAVFHEDRDGFLDNELVSDSRDPFDADNFGLRAKLRLLAFDTLDVVIGYNYYKQTGNGPQADIVPFSPRECPSRPGLIPPGYSTVLPLPAGCNIVQGNRFVLIDGRPTRVPPDRFIPAIEDGDPRAIYADRLSAQDDRYWGFSGKVDWQVPEMPMLGLTNLELIGGYQRTDTSFDWDFDSVSLPGFNIDVPQRVDEYSSELQWSGDAAERLRWQASLFFMRQKGEGNTVAPIIPDPDFDPLTPAPRRTQLEIVQEVENKSYGAALHGELDLTDAVTFSLGGRWIKDRKKSFLLNRRGAEYQACEGIRNLRSPDGFSDPVVPDCSETYRGTSWGAKMEWRPIVDDQLLFYAGIDRGYKSGGFQSGGVGQYDPEKIWAYTLGAKTEFFDSRLTLNLEGFFYAYEAMQLALIDGTKIRTENSDTRMYGWDLEASATPVPGLNLRAVVNFIDTETIDYYSLDPATLGNLFDNTRLTIRETAEADGSNWLLDDCPTREDVRVQVPCAQVGDRLGLDDFSGNDLSRSPRWKYTLSAEYEIPLGDHGRLVPRVQYTWQDDTYFRVFNRRFDLQEDYHRTDIKLTWLSPEDRWTVEAFVDNIEDEAVIQNILVGTRAFGSPPLAWYGEPRFYGVRVGFRY